MSNTQTRRDMTAIGLFDSGCGGENVLRHLRCLCPSADIMLLKDGAFCPYGERSEGELRDICARNIALLRAYGAGTVVIACCTASTAYLHSGESDPTVLPIIEPTAAAARANGGTTALIATAATVRSGAFATSCGADLALSISAGELVRMVERGICDENADEETKERIRTLLSPLSGVRADSLILGCTHFSALKQTIGDAARSLGIPRLTDSAMVAAELAARHCTDGSGTIYRITTAAERPRLSI